VKTDVGSFFWRACLALAGTILVTSRESQEVILSQRFLEKERKWAKSTSTWAFRQHFEPKWGFVSFLFFCMFKTERKIGKPLQRFVPHLYMFCFLPKKNYIHGAEGWGLFS